MKDRANVAVLPPLIRLAVIGFGFLVHLAFPVVLGPASIARALGGLAVLARLCRSRPDRLWSEGGPRVMLHARTPPARTVATTARSERSGHVTAIIAGVKAGPHGQRCLFDCLSWHVDAGSRSQEDA